MIKTREIFNIISNDGPMGGAVEINRSIEPKFAICELGALYAENEESYVTGALHQASIFKERVDVYIQRLKAHDGDIEKWLAVFEDMATWKYSKIDMEFMARLKWKEDQPERDRSLAERMQEL
jgi:hypothetical protein